MRKILVKDECMTCVLQNNSINFAARTDRAARILVLGKDLIVKEVLQLVLA